MISLFLSTPTWLHRVPAAVKLLALALMSLAVLPITDWLVMWVGVLITFAIYGSLGRAGFKRLLALRILLPLILGLGLFQWWVMTWEAAALSVARIFLMVMLADLVTLTTPMQDMMRVIEPLLSPLRRLGFNPRKLSLAVALVIRFVPVLLSQWQAQREAWQARSPRTPGVKLIVPFIRQALTLSTHIAQSIDARSVSRSKN
jgi:biotin transport system permease protein